MGRRSGAYYQSYRVSTRSRTIDWGSTPLLIIPGERRLHHKGTHSECIEKGLPELIPLISAPRLHQRQNTTSRDHSRLLKLLTGVETSTRPVNKSGREGKRTMRRRRKRKAAAKTPALLRSSDITKNQKNLPESIVSSRLDRLEVNLLTMFTRRWPWAAKTDGTSAVHGPLRPQAATPRKKKKKKTYRGKISVIRKKKGPSLLIFPSP